MKVTQQPEPKFIPVVITLETQEEVDILKDLVGRIMGSGLGRDFTSTLFDELGLISNAGYDTYFKGEILTYTKIHP